MARSRSSFEDLSIAIASATALGPADQKSPPTYRGVALVSFGAPEEPAEAPQKAAKAAPGPKPASSSSDAAASDELPSAADVARRPLKLPEIEGVVSPLLRCEKVIEWISDATGGSDVFLADSDGLPMAGAIAEAEARMASAGLVASAVAQLAAALPGNTSSTFELHVGEGPFFQLIGFSVGSSIYLVGLTRKAPLTPREAGAIRLACGSALGKSLTSGA
jgi:hypothetical protein